MRSKNTDMDYQEYTNLGDNDAFARLVHKLVLHLLDGFLDAALVESPHLILIEIPDLPQHLPRNLRNKKTNNEQINCIVNTSEWRQCQGNVRGHYFENKVWEKWGEKKSYHQ